MRMFTVGDLIRELQALNDPKRVVIMAQDAEGNGYSPMNSFWIGRYDDRTKEVGMEKLTPEDIEAGFSDSDIMEGGRAAVIFSPI